MPQPIAHYWVIENALNDLSNQNRSKLWYNYRNYSVFGSILPDLMYMSGVPQVGWMTTKGPAVDYSHISEVMHWDGFLDFYCAMLDYIKQLPEDKTKDKLKAFSFGVASHYAADADVHPRVYSTTGDHPFSHEPDKSYIKHKESESLQDIVIVGKRGETYREFNYGNKFICHAQDSNRTLDVDIFKLIIHGFEKAYAGKIFDNYGIDYERTFKALEGTSRHPLLESYRDLVTLYKKFSNYSSLIPLARGFPLFPQRFKVLLPRVRIPVTDLHKIDPDPRQKWVQSNNKNIPDLSFPELLDLAVVDTKAIITESEKFFDSEYTSSRRYFSDKSQNVPILRDNWNQDTGNLAIWNGEIKKLETPKARLECHLEEIVERYEWAKAA